VPAGKITLDLNYDDVQPIGAPEEVEFQARSALLFIPGCKATAKEFRLAIRPDARPEAGHFYSLPIISVWLASAFPSFSINEGMKFKGHDEAWGQAQDKEIYREALSPAER